MPGMLLAAWRYRYFIVSSIRTEFRTRFARSRLGGVWMVLHPLSQVMIFAFVLSAVITAKLPGLENRYGYSIYLMAGILGWSLFMEIVTRCLTIFIDSGSIMKKITFPRIALPLIVLGSCIVNNLLLFAAILAICVLLGHFPGSALAWFPLVMSINIALAVGVGLTLGVFNVFMRDIGQIVPVLLQFAYWLTPIVYTIDLLPADYRGLVMANPLYPVISGYQDALLFDRAPDLGRLAVVAVVAATLLFVSLVLFRRASSEIVDQL